MSLYSFQLPSGLLSNLSLRKVIIPQSHSLYRQSQSTSKELDIVQQQQPQPSSTSLTVPGSTPANGGAFTCTLTGATFNDLQQLREHYKTDWYKYNVKLRLQGKPTGVTEDEFNQLVEEPDPHHPIPSSGLSSISGSDSASSASDSDGASTSSSTNAVSRLLQKQRTTTRPVDPNSAIDELDSATLSGPRSALIWFEANEFSPGTQYGLYRAILPEAGTGKKREEGEEVLEELRKLQVPLGIKPGGDADRPRQWTLLMFGGGHFAGMVVSLVPRMVSKGKGKEKDREVVVLQKKTFHRYTTRRKQGGAQSANDNAKGKASSAGAQIRRHNETALRDEVQELLVSWTKEINDSELVFLRCSKTNYKTFFGYEKAPLDKSKLFPPLPPSFSPDFFTVRAEDPRIRGFSFPTARPTLNELIRAFTELTRVKTSHLTPEALLKLDASYLASITPLPAPTPTVPKPSLAAKPLVPKLSKTEELERDRWTRLVEMVKKGKTEAVANFLDKYGPELEASQERGVAWGALPGWMEESKTCPTLLHVASKEDQAEMVRWLLVEKRADPTLEASVIPVRSTPTEDPLSTSASNLAITASETPTTTSTQPTRSQTPYELAPSRATRNVFRLLVTSNPDWWDWTGTGPTGARIPSGLNAEQEELRDAKTRDRRGKLRHKLKEREKERDEKEQAEKMERERVEKELREKEEEELRRKGGNRVEKSGPQRLGGGPPRKVERALEGNLTDEQRMRVMREQRARAAEARFGK
ncbi:ankyrin repeat and zinc finger domain-containing protein 1, partial [Phenoliferia sp. Uapishka_3]